MARKLRFAPEGGGLFEVTSRIIHSRLLLQPDGLLNEVIIGLLARAKRLYPVELCGFLFMSKRFHLLVRVQDSQQPSESGSSSRYHGLLRRG